MQTLRHLIAKDNGNACVVFFIIFSVLVHTLCSQHALQEDKNNVIVVLLEMKKNKKAKNPQETVLALKKIS